MSAVRGSSPPKKNAGTRKIGNRARRERHLRRGARPGHRAGMDAGPGRGRAHLLPELRSLFGPSERGEDESSVLVEIEIGVARIVRNRRIMSSMSAASLEQHMSAENMSLKPHAAGEQPRTSPRRGGCSAVLTSHLRSAQIRRCRSLALEGFPAGRMRRLPRFRRRRRRSPGWQACSGRRPCVARMRVDRQPRKAAGEVRASTTVAGWRIA